MKRLFGAVVVLTATLIGCDGQNNDALRDGGQSASAKAMDTRNVKVEPGRPEFPDSKCGGPSQLHNYNNIPVNVTYTLYYEGKGPEQYCRVKWSSQEKMRLERYRDTDDHRWLGCAQYQYEGSPCIEERKWEVDLAEPAQPRAGAPTQPER